MDQLQEASDLFRIVRLCFRAVEDRFALFFAELFVKAVREAPNTRNFSGSRLRT